MTVTAPGGFSFSGWNSEAVLYAKAGAVDGTDWVFVGVELPSGEILVDAFELTVTP